MELKFIQSIVRLLLATGFILTNSISEELLHGPIVGQANITSNKVSVIFYREKSNDTENVPTVFMNDHIVDFAVARTNTHKREYSDSSIKLTCCNKRGGSSQGAIKKDQYLLKTLSHT